MDNRVFEYSLSCGFRIFGQGVTVYDRSEDNVVCNDGKLAARVPGCCGPKTDFSLPLDTIEKIKDIIRENEVVFEIDKYGIESSTVLDGVDNEFYFCVDDNKVSLRASNMWIFLEPNYRDYVREEPVNAKLVLKVFREIKKILIENGVDESYLQLDLQD